MNSYCQTPHLTHEQIANLLIADPTVCDLDLPQTASDSDAQMKAHLLECNACIAELAELRQSLAGFREAATMHAASQAQRHTVFVPAKKPAGYRQLALWSASAATLVVAVSAAFGVHRTQPAANQIPATPVQVAQAQTEAVPPVVPHTVESDEALLASIDQDLSASIPSSMQPLADPTATAEQTTSTSK